MPSEPLHIFDPRRTMHVQGFSGRAATTTIHDATETGLSISGIFQAAEDFAVLCLYNAYDFFNHLRLKPLPRTDLSGLKLQFDIEYDHSLDGAMRFDAPKYPSVSWDSITFVTGAGDIHEVKLLDHATAIAGTETPASVHLNIAAEAPAEGIDYYHLWFRDTRYTVAHTDCIEETRLTEDVEPGMVWMEVESAEGFRAGDWVFIERTGTNEEMVFLLDVDPLQDRLRAYVTIPHPSGSFVTLRVEGYHIAEKFAAIINDPNVGDIPGRYGPCQAAVITAEGGASGVRTGPGDSIASYLRISFKPNSSYGKLGNLDRVLATCGHSGEGQLSGNWLQRTARFTGGDTDKEHRVTLDFTQPLYDKNDQLVPVNDCRKIYLVILLIAKRCPRKSWGGGPKLAGVLDAEPNRVRFELDFYTIVRGEPFVECVEKPAVELRVQQAGLSDMPTVSNVDVGVLAVGEMLFPPVVSIQGTSLRSGWTIFFRLEDSLYDQPLLDSPGFDGPVLAPFNIRCQAKCGDGFCSDDRLRR